MSDVVHLCYDHDGVPLLSAEDAGKHPRCYPRSTKAPRLMTYVLEDVTCELCRTCGLSDVEEALRRGPVEAGWWEKS